LRIDPRPDGDVEAALLAAHRIGPQAVDGGNGRNTRQDIRLGAAEDAGLRGPRSRVRRGSGQAVLPVRAVTRPGQAYEYRRTGNLCVARSWKLPHRSYQIAELVVGGDVYCGAWAGNNVVGK
nr:hypothetical protein [Tanacetum cinerariifolium]